MTDTPGHKIAFYGMGTAWVLRCACGWTCNGNGEPAATEARQTHLTAEASKLDRKRAH